MAADVATNPPSHTSTGAGTSTLVLSSNSSEPKTVTFSSALTQHALAEQQQQQTMSQYTATTATLSPKENRIGSIGSFYSHHHQQQSPQHSGSQGGAPGGSRSLNPNDRNVPRTTMSMPSNSTTSPAMVHERRPSMSSGTSDMQSADALNGDPTAPRKRSKVSRACDECRRKKIRCDATSESGVEQCSSCKRVGSKCSFSRVPMKRGPSKGYIKELADRLNTLENSISTGDHHGYAHHGEGDVSPGPSDSTSPPPVGQKGARKRTLSSSSDFQLGPHLQPLSHTSPSRGAERLPSIDSFHSAGHQQHQQRSQLLQHESQRQLPQPPPPRQQPNPPPPGPPTDNSPLAHHSSLTERHYWQGYADIHHSPNPTYQYDVDHRPPAKPAAPEVSTFDWDEASIDQYYSLIHPTFPLLPHSKPRLRARLAAASITIREALLEALYAAVRSNPSSPAHAPPANPRRACELCVAAQFEAYDPQNSAAQNLLYLQTLILMALEADNHGPATIRGTTRLPRAAWVGSAVGYAYNLKLHHNQVAGERYAQGDPDSDEKLGRRAWWVLVVLDRWHAISTSSPLFIPDANVVLLPEDQILLGLTPFHLIRLSCILGHLSEAFTTADEHVSAASLNPYICRLLRGQLERFRESVEVVWGSLSLLHVAYYHVKLLTLRHNSAIEPRQLLEPALRMATMLDHSSMPITPLNHHFAALALITLCDLAEVEETREEAVRGIGLVDEALRKRRGLATREDSIGWDRAIKDLISKRERGGGLRELAELAMEREVGQRGGGRPERVGMEAGAEKLRRYGYLGRISL